jgi:hypothetical protein
MKWKQVSGQYPGGRCTGALFHCAPCQADYFIRAEYHGHARMKIPGRSMGRLDDMLGDEEYSKNAWSVVNHGGSPDYSSIGSTI